MSILLRPTIAQCKDGIEEHGFEACLLQVLGEIAVQLEDLAKAAQRIAER